MTLNIGTHYGSPLRTFTLPSDLSDRKIAMLAQSKKGKTYGLGVILEEMATKDLPFIASDPAQNLYGLRVMPDGRPSRFPVVVIGGPHGDLPFDKDQGERLAELLISEPTCAVIDVSFETGNASKKFWTDFANRLMRTKPETPPLIVLEEGSTLIPQHPIGMQAQLCKGAVSKVATIGGNFGYGVLVADQRPAKIDKDVLSQCDSLIVMGITHKKDRTTIREWIEAKDIGEQAEAAFETLGSLKPGEAWYWSPGEDRFERFTFRKRLTLHPREMQKLGLKSSSVKLGDMEAFVSRAKEELSRVIATIPDAPKRKANPKLNILGPESAPVQDNGRVLELEAQVKALQEKLSKAGHAAQEANLRLEAVRQLMRPQYDALTKLFGVIGSDAGRNSSGIDPGVYTQWLNKAPKEGIRKMLQHLIEKREATRHQLSTIAGVDPSSTYYNYVGWLTRNSLAECDRSSGMVRLKEV